MIEPCAISQAIDANADPNSKPLNMLLWYWGRRGSPVRITETLAHGLLQAANVRLFLSLSRQSEGFDRLHDFPATTCHVNTYTTAQAAIVRSLGLPRLACQMDSFVKRHRIEIVVAVMRHPWSGIIFRAMRRAGAKVMLMVHDAAPHTGERYRFMQPLFRFELNATDGIIVLSEHVRALMTDRQNYPSNKIWMMPHPSLDYLSMPRQHPRRLDGRRPSRLLFFGRIHEYKGLDVLADAYAHLRQQAPVTLRIVGSGWVPALDRLAAMPGVSVERRWIKDEEIGGLFEDADILLLPYTEASQSGVLAAAFGSGLPAVVTPVGGLSEQLRHGTGGMVAARADADAFAVAIQAVIDSNELYERLSADALALFRDYGAGESVKSLLTAARELCRDKPSAS